MSGKRNLKEILQNINPYLLDESFVFITSCEPIEDLLNLLNPKATFLEDEGMTLVTVSYTHLTLPTKRIV